MSPWTAARSGIRVGLAALFASCLVLLSDPAPASDPLIPPRQYGISRISEERTLAEDWVRYLKREVKSTSRVYATGERLYAEAQAGFNGWIDRLRFSLVQGENLSSPRLVDEYQRALEVAAKKNAEFISYVRDVTGQDVRGPLADIIESLLKGGIEIWKEWTRQNHSQRQEVLDALERLKFRSFAEIS